MGHRGEKIKDRERQRRGRELGERRDGNENEWILFDSGGLNIWLSSVVRGSFHRADWQTTGPWTSPFPSSIHHPPASPPPSCFASILLLCLPPSLSLHLPEYYRSAAFDPPPSHQSMQTGERSEREGRMTRLPVLQVLSLPCVSGRGLMLCLFMHLFMCLLGSAAPLLCSCFLLRSLRGRLQRCCQVIWFYQGHNVVNIADVNNHTE